eukprot:GDKH01018595.1.p3 GENE.GDKH01018595.1~~GDKH01018595.1.p3  ORF type:complete len:50 (+),score=9.39 GDKH01018595.1:66-215(+)
MLCGSLRGLDWGRPGGARWKWGDGGVPLRAFEQEAATRRRTVNRTDCDL